MKLNFDPNLEPEYRHHFIIVLLFTLSLLPACSEVKPTFNPTQAKTVTAEVTSITQVKSQDAPTSTPDLITNYSFPDKIKPEEYYLIYLHGKIIENEGIYAVSPEFGPYEYGETLKYFTDAGFNVISDVRSPNTDVDVYSDRVVSQVNTLLEQGVPGENITVVGFSKGGLIAIFTSSKLRNPRVNYVFIAICGDEINKIPGVSLAGRILSLYEESDEYGSTCKPLVERSPDVTGFEEIEFTTGLRHGAFYTADPTWLAPLISWLNESGP